MNQAPSPEGEAMAVFARVVWSAHILKYWTQLRGVKSHKPFEKEPVDDLDLVEQLDHLNLAEEDVEAFDDEDEEDDDVYNDFASDANAPLVADSESIRRKFLDHLAQTFSSAKGGPFVTVTALREFEDRVEVDVVRNDGFDDDAEQQDAAYFRGIEQYMDIAPSVPECRLPFPIVVRLLNKLRLVDERGSLLYDFEDWTIGYCKRRLQNIVQNLIRLLSPYKSLIDEIMFIARLEDEAAVLLDALCDWSTRKITDNFDSKLNFYVRAAFAMLGSGELKTVLNMLDNHKSGLSEKVERLIDFLSRPVTACRHFAKVARTLPQFANINIIHRQPPVGIKLEPKLVVSLDQAWQQLQLPQFANQGKFMKKFSQRFQEDCSRELRVHTEVQLLQLYEAQPHLIPTTRYLGCSKKACLLCETVLSLSNLGLVAGKRHGRLYPVWAVPNAALLQFGQRLSELANMIVQRISMLQTRETEFLECAIVESTIISDLRSKDLAEINQRQNLVETSAVTAEDIRLRSALL